MTNRSSRQTKRRQSPLTRVVAPIIRTGIRALSAAAPPMAGRAAFHVFVRPPRIPLHPNARRTMARARRFSVPLGTNTINAWTWGSGPAVLMTHGWGGRGGQLAAFVDPLLRRGVRVVTYDAPAHGSSTGRQTNVRQAADAARAIADTVGGIHGVIAHSLGATAILLAHHHGLGFARAAFVAPPDDLGHFFDGFAGQLGLSPAGLRHFEEQIERVTGVPWRSFRAEEIGRHQHIPLLIVHDQHDQEVPFSHGCAWQRAWPGSELVATTGLGHRAPLLDPEVIDTVAGFVTRASQATSAPAGAAV